MPFGIGGRERDRERDEMSMQTKIALGVGLAVGGWFAFQTGLLEGVLAPLMANSRLAFGAGVLLLIGWWAFDEADDGDDWTDIIGKTTDRAEDSTSGFLDGVTALVLGTSAVVLSLGMPIVDLLVQAPTIVANFVGIGAGLAMAMGFLTTPEFVGIAVVAVVAAVIIKRR